MVNLDNQTLLYLIVGSTLVTLLIMYYYVNSSVDKKLSRNNKKIIKKVSDEMRDTFKQYMGGKMREEKQPGRSNSSRRSRNIPKEESEYDLDSIEDPVGDDGNDIKE